MYFLAIFFFFFAFHIDFAHHIMRYLFIESPVYIGKKLQFFFIHLVIVIYTYILYKIQQLLLMSVF